MKFVFYNDTGRTVTIHPATFVHGCRGESEPIEHLETRDLELPKGTYPMVKMWDYGSKQGLQILVSPNENSKE